MVATKVKADLTFARTHVAEAQKLVARGSDRVQQAVLHLAAALDDVIKQLDE